ncbi:MAG: ribonuclease HI family protein [Spirochaetes bacterium]|jgi:ribonuclease HI|nr:ribonuclease HI family protein [Spirochaetota bacterium]
MLLSIDRVLQLLAEGKSVQKIAELSDVDVAEVCAVIEEARAILETSDKARSRKKIIIRRKNPADDPSPAPPEEAGADVPPDGEIFDGAELSAVPLDSSLVMYTDGASRGNPGPAGIGIVIYDSDNRQVGKVSLPIGVQTNNFAEYTALIHALRIGRYFRARMLKIRTDSELVVKQIKGEYKVNHENIKGLYAEAMKLKKAFSSCKIEHVTRNFNDKADYLAKKASELNK